MRTNLMDQTAGTAKRRYQGTTHSHTKPLIQVSRVEKKRGSELYLLSSPKGTSLSVHSQSNFTLTALHSLHITLPPRRKPVRGPRSVSCGPRGSLRRLLTLPIFRTKKKRQSVRVRSRDPGGHKRVANPVDMTLVDDT